MIGFQPYETFQLLVETGGVDRTNTLLLAACDAYTRRGKPTHAEALQFETLVSRLFPAAAPAARARAAATLGRAKTLSPRLEDLVIAHIGDGLIGYIETAPQIGEQALMSLVARNDIAICAAVATRGDLSNLVLAKLFQMNSRRVYRALARNRSIAPRGPYLSALARSAQMDHQVAASLAAREDFDCALLAPAFFDLSDDDRLKVIAAFAQRTTPGTTLRRTLEQLSVATQEFAQALMKLFSENRRPEVTRLLQQVTGLDEVRCGQIAHDVSGASLFVVLRAFGCGSHEGLKVLIHASSYDGDRSQALARFAKLFESVSADAMTYLLSAWRGEVNLLDLAKPEYMPFSPASRRTPRAGASQDSVVEQAMDALSRIGARRAS